jgi:hypothetical protein
MVSASHGPCGRTVSNRVAWSEASVSITPPLRDLYNELLLLRQPLNPPSQSQIIHGDLTGNVLFPSSDTEGLLPAVIDFSPYFRPPEFADAVIVADGLLYHSQGQELVELAGTSEMRLQMLVRAIIFRLVARSELAGEKGEVEEEEELGEFEGAVGVVKGFLSKAAE